MASFVTNMSNIQDENYKEYLHENNICFECLKKITVVLRDDGTTQSEWNMQDGHKGDCYLFEVEDNDGAIEARLKRHQERWEMPEIKKEKVKSQQRMMNSGEIYYESDL